MRRSFVFVLIFLLFQSSRVCALGKFAVLRRIHKSIMKKIAPKIKPFPFVRYNWRGFSGEPFPSFNRPGELDSKETALIVIDMQKGFITREGAHEDKENRLVLRRLFEAQKATISLAASKGMPVYFVEYNHLKKTQEKLLRHAKQEASSLFIHRKTSNGIFSESNQNKSELVEDLKSKKIKNLIIIGANGGSCIKASINSALEEEYRVVVYSEAIADFNSKKFKHPCDYRTNIFFRNALRESFIQIQDFKELAPLFALKV